MSADRALQEWQRRLRALSLILDHFASGELTYRTDASILEELCESELAARAAYHAHHTSKRRASGGRTAASKTSSAQTGSPAKSSSARRPSTAKSSSAGRRDGDTRANQALELVRSRPGITIPQIAEAMKIEPNYLYRVMPKLVSDKQVRREGQGWYPASTAKASPGVNLERESLREGFARPELFAKTLAKKPGSSETEFGDLLNRITRESRSPEDLPKKPGSSEIDWAAEFGLRTAGYLTGGPTGASHFPGPPTPARSIGSLSDTGLVLADMKPLIDMINDPNVEQAYEKMIVPVLRRQPRASKLLQGLKDSLDRNLDCKAVLSVVVAQPALPEIDAVMHKINEAVSHLAHLLPH